MVVLAFGRAFGLSVQVPGKAGDTLTFKALQTYSTARSCAGSASPPVPLR
jgi:hypothetical protein